MNLRINYTGLALSLAALGCATALAILGKISPEHVMVVFAAILPSPVIRTLGAK